LAALAAAAGPPRAQEPRRTPGADDPAGR
jgi:hypothetical protein